VEVFCLLSLILSLTLPAVAAGRCTALRRLQEVVGRPARDHGFAGSGARVELQAKRGVREKRIFGIRKRKCSDVQGILEVFVDLHDRCLVATAVAVVGCCNLMLTSALQSRNVAAYAVPEKIVTTFRSWLQL